LFSNRITISYMMLMKNIFLPLIIFLIHSSLFAQTVGDYRSATTGNWNTLATWQRYNGTTWVTPTGGQGVPSSASGTITILNGHTVSIPNVNQSADQMTINSGGQVTVGTGRTWTIANGIGTDLTVNGIIVNSGTITPTGTISFGSGSTYQHSQNGGAIPTATWNSNSTCQFTGVTTTNPTNMGQTFGNLTWNCPSQTSDANFDGIFTINGNFTLISTGTTGIFRLAAGTTNIGGNYSQSAGINRLSNTSNRTLNVGGSFSMSGGELRMSIGSAIGTMNITGNFSHTGGTITETSTGTGLIVFNGSTNQNITVSGTISNTINFTINNPAGITLLTSVNFPAALSMTNGNISLNGNTLTLGTGNTASTRGTLNWTSGFFTGTGSFRRWFDGTAITIGTNTGLFPMGNGTNNRSVWIAGTPTTGGTLSIQHTNSAGTTAISFTENSLSFDKRTNMSWTLSTANGFAGLSLALRIQGSGIPGINAVGDLNICLSSGIAGGTYSAPGGSVTNPQVNRSGLTQTNLANTFYFASTSGSPLPVELSYFAVKTLKGGGAQLDWKTETEISNYGFEVYRLNQSNDWKLIGFVEGYGNSNSPKEYLFEDKNVSLGKYSYRLKQIDTDGKFTYSKTIEINFGLPAEFELSQNYPNPFNPVTTIKFSLPESGNVKLTIYNLLGEQVVEPVNEFKNAGVYTINFNASELNSGVYIYKIESNGFVQSRKMTLIK
jgi:hypothetical protein